MTILLVAVNAKYIHSNLAVYSLKAYAEQYSDSINIVELTINHSEEEILKQIYLQKADVIAFSCYIWNIDIIKRITSELRKIQKQVKIWYGGPEVSYDAIQCLESNKDLDGVMIGEGEQTFLELVEYYVKGKGNIKDINGLAYKESARITYRREGLTGLPVNGNITTTQVRRPMSLDVIPFPYEDMEIFRNKIIYYESSRGCPFSCSYCLSSIDKQVRLRSTELVKKDLKFLMEYQVPQVKFVDRTFNCNRKHSMDIWTFIKENDNGITNFHFEISADLLNEEEIDFLSTLRPGQVQLEIGVQSTNRDTVRVIHRQMDFELLKSNVNKIRDSKNIHQHLDLIGGLPLEGYTSFEKSFGDVYRLKPDQLQLGFLKVLKGSLMYEESHKYGIEYHDFAPYEVLSTNDLSYDELLKLKGICEMVEVYYNSAQFTYAMSYLDHKYKSPMKLYQELSDYYIRKQLASIAHNRIRRFEILLEFFQEVVMEGALDADDEVSLFTELLILDLFLRERMKSRPTFAPDNPAQDKLRGLYIKYQTARKMVHIEQFNFDVINSSLSGKVVKKRMDMLFDYSNRDPLNNAAHLIELD